MLSMLAVGKEGGKKVVLVIHNTLSGRAFARLGS